MSVSDYIHPSDAAALDALKKIPALPSVMKKVFELGLEDIMWAENITTNVRLSKTQMPEVYNLLPPICQKLGIKEPELYLNMSPLPNAWTSGHERTYIVVTFGLVRRCTSEELTAAIAHECGHILCEHVMYHMLADYIFSLGESLSESKLGQVANLVTIKGLRQALFTWQRASELSADRVACSITSALTLAKVLAKLERIPYVVLKEMDYKEWAKQGAEYERLRKGNLWNKVVRWMSDSDLSHPYGPVRAYEAFQWEAKNKARVPKLLSGERTETKRVDILAKLNNNR